MVHVQMNNNMLFFFSSRSHTKHTLTQKLTKIEVGAVINMVSIVIAGFFLFPSHLFLFHSNCFLFSSFCLDQSGLMMDVFFHLSLLLATLRYCTRAFFGFGKFVLYSFRLIELEIDTVQSTNTKYMINYNV